MWEFVPFMSSGQPSSIDMSAPPAICMLSCMSPDDIATPAADVPIGSIASTGQQLSLSFGVAAGSLVTAWFLGPVDQTDAACAIPALHDAFLTLGLITIASAATRFSTAVRLSRCSIAAHCCA